MNKKAILDDIWSLIFLVIVILSVFLLFLAGTVGKEIKVKNIVDSRTKDISSDYLLVQYLRMPVNCNGQDSLINCWDKISLSSSITSKCKEFLQSPTMEFFKDAGIPTYLVQFFQDNHIVCALSGSTGSSEAKLTETLVSDIALPSPDPTKALKIHLELIP